MQASVTTSDDRRREPPRLITIAVQTIKVQDDRIVEVRPFHWDTAAIAAACATPQQTIAE